MSKASSLPYKLRPNKAVDRELFLSILGRLAPILNIESYQYLGLGGPYLEDFRLIHARLGIDDMVCVDMDKNVHLRQYFNRPVECIECVYDTLENYIDITEFKKQIVIWFDYTDPGSITEQIERFTRTISEVPINSILRITLNANPSSLGKPDNEEISVELGDMNSQNGNKKNIQEWRLEQFKKRLGNLFPSGMKPNEMTFKNFGRSVLKSLSLAVDKEILSCPDRNVIWLLATHYADGQPMVTATLIICAKNDESLQKYIDDWIYKSSPNDPLLLDLPALSTLERLIMESKNDAKELLGFELPLTDMGVDPFESFKKYYRVFPHFSRVEL
ncbi:MAG: hypothetical protein COW63_13620 [Bacteroidetes bacterium CG18_big_fil_WC_8_21_14_2_50_41_14]|nr:MAG: hypothetical protein COW63_13620 [Bacteroidetes bacterium CG18_big_fil_WC_8_21_14_2_50_41_14]